MLTAKWTCGGVLEIVIFNDILELSNPSVAVIRRGRVVLIRLGESGKIDNWRVKRLKEIHEGISEPSF